MLARGGYEGYYHNMHGVGKPDQITGGSFQDRQRAASAVVAQEQRALQLEKYQNATRLPGSEHLVAVSVPTIFDAIKSLIQKGVPIAVLAPLLLAACGEAQATPGGAGGVNIEPTRAIVVGVNDPSRGEPLPTSTIAGTVIAVPAAPTREPTATIEPTATAVTASPTVTTRPVAPGTPATPGKPEANAATPVVKEIPKYVQQDKFLLETWKNQESLPKLELEDGGSIKPVYDEKLKFFAYKNENGEVIAVYNHGPFPRISKISTLSTENVIINYLTDFEGPFSVNFDTTEVDMLKLNDLFDRARGGAKRTYNVDYRIFGVGTGEQAQEIHDKIVDLKLKQQDGIIWAVTNVPIKDKVAEDPGKYNTAYFGSNRVLTEGSVTETETDYVVYLDPRKPNLTGPVIAPNILSGAFDFTTRANFSSNSNPVITSAALTACGLKITVVSNP